MKVFLVEFEELSADNINAFQRIGLNFLKVFDLVLEILLHDKELFLSVFSLFNVVFEHQ